MLSPGSPTFKANRPGEQVARLASHSLLAVHGPDAAAFLQAQTMNDVLALAPGQWQWNGWLSAKGRVVALFALLRAQQERFLVVLPDFPAERLRAGWQTYVFRSKLRIELESALACAAQWPSDSARIDAPTPEQAQGDEQRGWRLDMGGDGGARVLWLLPGEAMPATGEGDVAARWRDDDIAHGLPRLPPEGVEAWTPQMLSLERLAAFSLKKGCYPGQEIVARTHYLGKAKRGLLRVGGQGLASGQALLAASGGELGQLACTSEDGRQGLAVAAIDRVGDEMVVAGAPVHALPLLDGLRRPL